MKKTDADVNTLPRKRLTVSSRVPTFRFLSRTNLPASSLISSIFSSRTRETPLGNEQHACSARRGFRPLVASSLRDEGLPWGGSFIHGRVFNSRPRDSRLIRGATRVGLSRYQGLEEIRDSHGLTRFFLALFHRSRFSGDLELTRNERRGNEIPTEPVQ